ncbi:MAG: hypothetical protein ACP5U2_12890 [Bryobacteraceae bacterium]
MPYCCQCGNSVAETDRYCRKCGARQPAPEPPAQTLNPRTVSVLCYAPVVGWIAAVAVLAGQRYRHDRTVRFHAFQGLYLFVAWLIVQWVVRPFFHALPAAALRPDKWLSLGLVVLGIFMMVKASRDERYSLPILGELAEKSAAES